MCSKELERFGDLITMPHEGDWLILEDFLTDIPAASPRTCSGCSAASRSLSSD